MGASGLEVPRLDNLLWQGLSDDKNDSSSCAGRIEEEMNDAQADFNTGERKINIPESDAANNSNSSSDGNTDVVMVVDTGHIEGDQVPEQTVINSSTSRDDSNNAEGATDMAQVDEGYSQTFNVIREERYVRAFRVEFMSCSDDMDSREVDEAFLYSFMAKGDEKNMNDARKEDFYSRNWKLFYSLMECLARKPPLCLPFQSFLPVLLVPIGRGVCRDGTAIFIPSKDDYLEFVYYHEKRAEPSLSSSRQANKRLGEWRGIDSNIPRTRCGRKAKEKRSDIPAGGAISDLGSIPATREDRSSEICEERNLMGYVTSGRYSGSPCGSVSYGFCDATLYQEMAISAAQLLVEYKGTGIVGSRSPPRGRVLSLVMFRSPRSRWLRPALVDMISVLQ